MRILMLGNSLTTANGLPGLLSDCLHAEVVVHARGGARLAEHLNPATKLGARTAAAFAGGHWDFVVLQEMSNAPATSTARYLHACTELCAQAHDAGASPVIYASWAYAPNCPKLGKLGLTHDQMHAQLHAAFLQAAKAGGAVLADVGTAFYEHPEKAGLYAPDGVHPSQTGTELAVECLAAAMRGAAMPAAQSMESTPYFVYMLLCEDGSYYTGITTDVERRFQEHAQRGAKGARYTRTHPVKEIAAVWEMRGRSDASKVEARIKRLKHDEKQLLAADPTRLEVLIGL